jgi:hypothetical protein
MAEHLWRTLPLAGYQVPVYLVDGLEDAHGCPLEGEADEGARVIRLDAGLTEAQRLEVLIHECLHLVASVYGRRLSETTVRTLALGLHQMLAGVVEVREAGEAAS